MEGSLTLITPPEIYENLNTSVLFCHLSEVEQDITSRWLRESKIIDDINLYVYTHEENVTWLLHALGCCQYKYIDIDRADITNHAMMGYILGKNGVCYKTDDDNLAKIYSHINPNKVASVDIFLERAFSEY
jgi:hypothetical protein